MLFQADAALIPFADKTFHTCVTSPPYWGLRKYQGEQGRGQFPNLGLEPTPQEHIQHIVEIFREVKRVLRDDGVVWLNYGDCYSSGQGGYDAKYMDNTTGMFTSSRKDLMEKTLRKPPYKGMPPGNLMLMPHRIAIALQDDGWVVRNDLVWRKSNPMPESCAGWRFERSKTKTGNRGRGGEDWRDNATETPQQRHAPDGSFLQDAIYEYGEDYELRKGSWRHTRAHEFIFMLTKKMQYWCNQEAARVRHDDPSRGKGEHESKTPHIKKREDGRAISMVFKKRQYNPAGRNPRSVLDVPTAPYKGAHYATFPPNLIAPLIRASCPRRACPECGQGWSPVVEKEGGTEGSWHDHQNDQSRGQRGGDDGHNPAAKAWSEGISHNVKSYRPTCECGHDDEYVPGICLDPFIGSGTTGAVAKELQRRWVGLDISMEYLDEQAKIRAMKLTPSKALDDLPLFNL